MRAALHSHSLCWFRRRRLPQNYRPMPAIERTVPGTEPRQRPLDQTVEPLREKQESNVYQHAEVGPITAEMVRPDVSGNRWGGYCVEKLRISGLARAVQTRLPYTHVCSSFYCLKAKFFQRA